MSILSRAAKIAKAHWQQSSAGPDSVKVEPVGAPDESDAQQGNATGEADDTASSRNSELATCYANLELPYGADLESIKKARKRLLARYHPDKHGNDPDKQALANELSQQLNRAYDYLERHLQKS